MYSFKIDDLEIKKYESRDDMGRAAASDIAKCIKALLEKQPVVNMIFAAAPSQNEMLKYLCDEKGIDWKRINAFHMDEYVGLKSDAPQCFSNYLRTHIFDIKPFKSVNCLNADVIDSEAECRRYSKLLYNNPCDIVCMGIGENGHIAFNDPHVADFNDKAAVKVVDLDAVCRMQQVNDGCFASIDDVPKYAMTLTIPVMMAAKYRFCVVPGPTKAKAVYETLYSNISEKCPAGILRTKKNSVLYCDNDSSSLLNNK